MLGTAAHPRRVGSRARWAAARIAVRSTGSIRVNSLKEKNKLIWYSHDNCK